MFKKNKGFTLIELLVVIAIIGTLSGIVLVSLGTARQRARDARRQSDIRQIATALEMDYNDDEAYISQAAIPTQIPVATGIYLNPVPDDPQPTANYTWLDNSAACVDGSAALGEWYCIYATLEGGGVFAASHKGTREQAAAPVNDATACCW